MVRLLPAESSTSCVYHDLSGGSGNKLLCSSREDKAGEDLREEGEEEEVPDDAVEHVQ